MDRLVACQCDLTYSLQSLIPKSGPKNLVRIDNECHSYSQMIELHHFPPKLFQADMSISTYTI